MSVSSAQVRALELLPIDYGTTRDGALFLPAEAVEHRRSLHECEANGWAAQKLDRRQRVCGWRLTAEGEAVLAAARKERRC